MKTESLLGEAIRELSALRCACGAAKRHGHSFCYACFHSLPVNLRRELWRPLSEGYAEAYVEAKEWLRTHTKI